MDTAFKIANCEQSSSLCLVLQLKCAAETREGGSRRRKSATVRKGLKKKKKPDRLQQGFFMIPKS